MASHRLHHALGIANYLRNHVGGAKNDHFSSHLPANLRAMPRYASISAVKYMGQLLDHLGYTIVGEWYVVGEYKPDKFREHSKTGRLGDIRGRPNEEDLRDVAEKVKGILRI